MRVFIPHRGRRFLTGFTKERQVLTVSELTRRIKTCLEDKIGYVWIGGEVSNLRTPISGHIYFSLKDESTQIKCVLFAGTARSIKFALQEGMELIVFGRVSVYEKSGDYQIIIDKAEPKGIGAQQLALEQLKQRLVKEGLFDPAHKKTLPLLPLCVGIITSATGAAIQDILNIIQRRFTEMVVLIYPVRVQGEGAADEMVNALQALNQLPGPEVLVLARGGGSAEDLSAFNDERLARAIYDSVLPVVSAVGHEIDLTIADLVADKRAATPSEAAELVVPLKSELMDNLADFSTRLKRSLKEQVDTLRLRLDGLRTSYAFQAPLESIRQYQQRLDEFSPRLLKSINSQMQSFREKLKERAGRLEAVSPLAVLQRGYSITRDDTTKTILRSIKQVKTDQEILTRLIDGEFLSLITHIPD